jgi:hypothetical protein
MSIPVQLPSAPDAISVGFSFQRYAFFSVFSNDPEFAEIVMGQGVKSLWEKEITFNAKRKI